MFSAYTNKSVKDILRSLDTSESGLSKKEALLRQEQYGLNEVKAKKVNGVAVLIRQFRSPFSYLLIIAALTSTAIGHLTDSVALIIFILINAVIGFFQEYKAERSVALLKKFIPEKVIVYREGKREIIDRNLLVPGDLVILAPGSLIPADLRIIESQGLLVNESSLTGESVAVPKNADVLNEETNQIYRAKNMLFSSTIIVAGRAKGIVVSSGINTVFGGIEQIVVRQKSQSSYEKNVLYFCRLILRIVIVTIGIIFIANMLIKGLGNLVEFSLFCIALIVSILPEALPTVVTFALSAGSLKMAKEDVVVKQLSAVEDIGNIEVLCTDKTGTLTQNKLSLEKIVSSNQRKSFLYGILGNGKENNPFEAALYARASQETIADSKKFQVVYELPFDSYRMRSAFLVKTQKGEKILIVKGAPESIIKQCAKTNDFDKRELLEDIKREGEEGKRVLAVAFKHLSKEVDLIRIEDEKGLDFLGYFVFEDPLKASSKEAILAAKRMGVQIKIITGDAPEVAEYVARKIGLVPERKQIISGDAMEKLVAEDFDYACREHFVFARVSPDIKYKIIKSLQKEYEVGFIGDGINDAPALKVADVGIAVAGSSDVAKEAADVVLLKKDLRVVVDGIKNGRIIFSNINKYIKSALASNVGNFYSIAVISLFINFLPMLPVQILLGNILSDFPLIAIATDSVGAEELRKPKLYQLHNVLPLIISLALVSTLFDFIFFALFSHQSQGGLQTLWFVESILTEISLIFVIRTRGVFYKAKRPGFWLSALTLASAVIVLVLPVLPIGASWFKFAVPSILPLLAVLGLVIAYFIMSEMVKLIYFRYFKVPDLNSSKSVVQ